MVIRVPITSAIHHRLTHPILGFILIITFLQQLSGYGASDPRGETLDKKHIKTVNKNEEKWISTLLNSFMNGKIHEAKQHETDTEEKNVFNVALQNVRSYLVKSVAEKLNFEEHVDKGNSFYYDFEILRPYIGNQKRVFERMVEELQRHFRSSIQNCKTRTKKDFRGWVDRYINGYMENGICKYFPNIMNLIV